MEVTGSVGLLVIESLKHTLCQHLAHLGLLDAEVLVKICPHLVHLWVRMREILINFP